MIRLRTAAAITAPLAVAGTLVAVAPASAAQGVERSARGTCTMGSTWDLDLEREHGRIEVDFDADTHRARSAWDLKIKQNGKLVHRATYRTDREGDLDVDRKLADRPGKDTIIVRAKSTATGEVCRAVLKI